VVTIVLMAVAAGGILWLNPITQEGIMAAVKSRTSDGLGSNPPDLDLKTGETSAETLGVAFGAMAGSAASATAGLAMGGPAGMVVGAIAGGLAGAYSALSVEKDFGRAFDRGYWQDHYPSSTCYDAETRFDTYEPAYRLGWESYFAEGEERAREDRERQLQEEWESNREAGDGLDWRRAREATREAWQRAARIFPRGPVPASEDGPDQDGPQQPR
jgi:hypothetical protein